MEVVKATKLDEIVREINTCIMQGAQRFLKMGALLKAVRDGNLWMHSGASTFREWAEREVKLKKSAAYAAIDSFEKYQHVIDADPTLATVEQSRLTKLLPFANGDERTNDLLHMAKEADARGFEENLKELRGGMPTDVCEHPLDQQENFQKCKVCNRFHRITDIGDDSNGLPDATGGQSVNYRLQA